MGLSTDPRKRQRQLANLQPGARVQHGAHSELILSPLREQHRASLLTDYPKLDERRLALLSDLLARIEEASGHLDRRGLVKDRRTLEPRPLVKLLDAWQQRAWRMLAELENGGRQTPEAAALALMAQIEADYAEGDD